MAFSLSRRLYIPPCRRRHAGLALAVNMQGCAALCTKRATRLASVAFEATPAAATAATAAMRTVRRLRRAGGGDSLQSAVLDS